MRSGLVILFACIVLLSVGEYAAAPVLREERGYIYNVSNNEFPTEQQHLESKIYQIF